MIIYAVLSHFDFVAKFTVKNLNKDFTNTGGGHHFMKVFHKTEVFFKGWLPLVHLKESLACVAKVAWFGKSQCTKMVIAQ